MSRSSSAAILRGSLVAGFAIGLLGVGLILGLMLVGGCSENLDPNTDRGRVCESMTDSGSFNWWVAVISPALALLVSQVVPWFRRRPLLISTAIVLVTIAGWRYLLLVVSSNIGDTTSG